ncbi:MAG TPA: ArsR family transcriptional regulator [Candidatus Poseidoniales archaeon]|jgi:ArsR family transcriptional regulator|nr:MAG: transcriptional regulator [Euryarchaeota archaeon]HIF46617.1 ArsR family transcriptional regulator [Candidatus Poseidoniales archaeon]HIL65387.1 ArsR family transcriptional regulator [Candidatus Poseidoniales archaeon]
MLDVQNRLEPEFVKEVSEIIKLLGHADRIAIVEYIQNGEKNVGQISKWCDLTQPITSQHLRLLKDKGVVSCRRDGNMMKYSLPNPLVHKMLDCLVKTQEEMKERD